MRKRGFTLIELLVAMSIIAFLGSVGLNMFIVSQKKARDARRRVDLREIQSAMEQYYLIHDNVYYNAGNYDGLGLTYFPNGAPQDPKFNTSYNQAAPSSTSYRVSACLEMTGTCTSVSTREDFSIRNLQ